MVKRESRGKGSAQRAVDLVGSFAWGKAEVQSQSRSRACHGAATDVNFFARLPVGPLYPSHRPFFLNYDTARTQNWLK